jgi:DNA-binding beta-propeller fold protein YncE
VLDGKSGRLLADVRVSAPVTAMTTGGGLVLAGTVSRTIAEIDPNRRRVVRVVGVAAAPNALAFAGNGIWVASGFGGTLTRVGLDGFELPSFRPEPRANGRLALAAQGSSVWVGSQDDELTRLDVSGRRTGSGRARHPDAMAVAYGSLWIAQATSVELLRADPETGRRSRSVPLGAPCTSIAAGAGAVWALGAEATMLWRIDPASNAVTAAIRVMPDATDVVAGTSVWVLARPTGTVEEIDPRRNAVVRTVALGRPIGGAVLADGRLWIGLR